MKIDGLPDELNNSALIREAPDLLTLAKTAVNLERMVGNSIRIPGEGAGEADIADFRAKALKVGLVPRGQFTEFVRPEKPEQYEIKDPPQGAEAVVTQTEINGWKTVAHEMGLSPGQFEQFATRQINDKLASREAQQARFGEVDAKVAAKYGAGAVDAVKARALAAMEKYAPELAKRVAAEPDAETIMGWSEVGKTFGERGMGDLTPRSTILETPAEAEIKLAEIRNNPNHPANKPSMGRAAHQAGLDEKMRLQRIALKMDPRPSSGDYVFDERS